MANWALPLVFVTIIVVLVESTVLGSTKVGIYGILPYLLVLCTRIIGSFQNALNANPKLLPTS